MRITRLKRGVLLAVAVGVQCGTLCSRGTGSDHREPADRGADAVGRRGGPTRYFARLVEAAARRYASSDPAARQRS